MTHDRPARAWRSVAHRAASARQVVRLGSWKVPVVVVTLGLSVILHGGLLAAAYLVAWRPATVSHPEISFAKGDQATRIQVLFVPWPDPAEEEEPRQAPQEDTSASELSAVIISAEEMDGVPVANDVPAESRLAPPVTSTADRDPPTDKAPEATKVAEPTDLAEERALEDVPDVPPADDAVEATPRTQPVEAILGQLFRQLERVLAPPEKSEQVDRPRPIVAEAVEEAAVPLIEEPVQSKASSAQTAGVETGVEMLDLPTPTYPSLSRRRGEEGLVLLQVEVLPDGSVGKITAIQDAGYRRLTEAAISAAGKGRFKPATRDGQPIRATVRIPFRFVLD